MTPRKVLQVSGPKLPKGAFDRLVAKAAKNRQPNWAALGCGPEEIAEACAQAAADAAKSLARKPPVTRARLARKFAGVMPADQLRALPTDEQAEHAVYFLWLGPQLIYVGQTIQAQTRFEQHYASGKRWSRATMLAVPHGWGRTVEADYVRRYRPPLNRTSSG